MFFGAPAGIRTPDTLLKRQVLCLLSYWGESGAQRTLKQETKAELSRNHQIEAQRARCEVAQRPRKSPWGRFDLKKEEVLR